MAVYKLFPSADTFIFTEAVSANAGLDELIEIGGYEIQGYGQTTRGIVQFNNNEIQNVVNNKITSASFPYSASLELKLCTAYETPKSHSVFVYPISGAWSAGIGKYADTLGRTLTTGSVDQSGVSWRYRQPEKQEPWTLSSFTAEVTASYNSNYPGGGNWYTSSFGIDLEATQSFNTSDNLDLNVNVTPAVKLHYSGTLPNYGFIIKLQDSEEFAMSSSLRHKYYSNDTNTIYPPSLTFKWDDSSYETGSLSLLTSSKAIVNITNNRGEYQDIGKVRFRLLARPSNPVRVYTTGSIYKTNYALPSASYYAIQDNYTEELEIPFDSGSTKISCDATGPFFDVYMHGLQPERFYKILIKSELDGTTTVFDSDNIFKVVRNG